MPPNPFSSRDPEVTVGIGGNATPLNRATESAKDNLGELGRAANRAGDRVEEFGDDTTQAAAQTSTFATTTSAAASSMGAFGIAAQASAIPAAGALVSTLAPLTAVLGTVTAAAGSLAGAFGTILGSGILAFGKERAQQNKEQLLRVQDRIQALKELKKEEGGLTDQQRLRLRQLEERENKLDDATTAMGAFKLVLEDLAAEIAPIITQFGQQFVPLIEDALDAVPDLVENMFDATGSMEEFKDAMRDFGAGAFEVIPQIFAGMFELARMALPVVRDLFEAVGDRGAGVFDRMLGVTQELAPELQDLLGSLADLAGPLTTFGTTVLEVVLPSLTGIIDAIADGLRWFNDLDDGIQSLATKGILLAPILFKVGGALTALTGPLGLAALAVGAFATAYITNFHGIRDVTNRVLGRIGGVVRDQLAFVRGLIRANAGEFAKWKGTIRTVLRGFNDLDDGIQSLATKGILLAPILFKVGGALTALTGPLGLAALAVGAFATAYITNFHGIRDVTNRVLGRIGGVVRDQLAFVRGLIRANAGEFAKWKGTIRTVLRGFRNAIRQVRPIVEEVIGTFLPMIVQKVRGVWKTHFGAIVNETRETVAALVQIARVLGNRFNAFWTEWGDEIMAVARAAFDFVTSIAATQMDALLTGIRVAMNLIQGDWGEAWSAIRGFVDRTLGRVRRLIDEWGPVAKSALQDAMDNAVAGAELALEWLTTDGVAMVKDLVRDAEPWLTKTGKSLLKGAIDALTTGARLALEWFSTDGVPLIKDLINIAVTWLKNTGKETAKTGIRQITNAVSGILEDLGEDAIDWGKGIIDGLISGIESKLDELRTAAENAGGVIKEYLGASSNTERGPLSTLESWGPEISRTVAEGMVRERVVVEQAGQTVARATDPRRSAPSTAEMRQAVADGVSQADVGSDGGRPIVIEVDGRRLAEVTRDAQHQHIDKHLVTK